MKKAMLTICLIAACAALCAAVLPRSTVTEETPAAVVERKAAPEVTALPTQTAPLEIEELPQTPDKSLMAEKENAPVVSPQSTITTQTPAPPTPLHESAQSSGSDPCHTDVYPNNVYSEEYTYDENGKLISKSVTTPATFGPETIWIDGHAYADVPGFGLVEWGGPSTVTHFYDMYENGNKVGIMGG